MGGHRASVWLTNSGVGRVALGADRPAVAIDRERPIRINPSHVDHCIRLLEAQIESLDLELRKMRDLKQACERGEYQ